MTLLWVEAFKVGCCLKKMGQTHVILIAERLWLPSGFVLGGCPHGRMFFLGPSLVCSCNCHLHCTHRLSENGKWVQRSRRTATVSRGQVKWNTSIVTHQIFTLCQWFRVKKHKPFWSVFCKYFVTSNAGSREWQGFWCLFSLEFPSSLLQF